ncbi:hypothetical protein BK659_10945 [Pseudomonas brassicacearum]|uniref:Glucosyl transferase GtrII n=1 Tax=Pseudomonas brassicacearum TaxID=930166 RepID=A0A423H8C2_9PSED|nr:glucosyltransferase domain-containing protein [Pseudomonas brassicacearum]RON09435.1 hypothetical protein BK659_10945 [Pseudomonas brassicacearum]
MFEGILSRPWARGEVYVFFQVMTFLYVFPIVYADYMYIDDHWRAVLGLKGWTEDGRPLVELFYTVMTFSLSVTNVFPLPLLIATIAISLALTKLTEHYFSVVGLVGCLVVLPLWYSPFFLQNLSYQYDGPTMVLGIVAVIYAITYKNISGWWLIILPAVLIAVALSFYQVCLNVFVGLSCIDVYRCINSGASSRAIVRAGILRVAQLTGGLSIYCMTSYQLISGDRQGFISLNSAGMMEVIERISTVTENVFLLFNSGNSWLFLILAVMASISFLLTGYERVLRKEGMLEKSTVLVIFLLTMIVSILAVYGIDLFVSVSYSGARNLLGFSSLLVFMLLLNAQLLVRIHRHLGLFLVVPLFFMLTFSYAYGRVMIAKKEFEYTVVHSLNYDVVSREELRRLEKIWLVVDSTYDWIPGASRTLKASPAISYILALDFLVLPETMRTAGLTNVLRMDNYQGDFSGCGACKLVVSSRYYYIYTSEENGYVVMKRWTAAKDFDRR